MRMRNPGEQPGKKHRSGATLLALAFIAVPLVMMLSCYPGEITSVEELDIVGTIYGPNVDYSKYYEYVLPDSIVLIDDRNNPGSNNPIPPALEQQMIQAVVDRMTGLNYSRVTDVNAADVGILVSVILSDQLVITGGYPGGCGWYPGWPCWGYYPPVGQAYSYDTGTVLMDMFEFGATAQDSVNIVWQGALNGVASSTSSVNQKRILDGINQAFKQSPYLRSAGPGGP